MLIYFQANQQLGSSNSNMKDLRFSQIRRFVHMYIRASGFKRSMPMCVEYDNTTLEARSKMHKEETENAS